MNVDRKSIFIKKQSRENNLELQQNIDTPTFFLPSFFHFFNPMNLFPQRRNGMEEEKTHKHDCLKVDI
jgi:hypothetical protein